MVGNYAEDTARRAIQDVYYWDWNTESVTMTQV